MGRMAINLQPMPVAPPSGDKENGSGSSEQASRERGTQAQGTLGARACASNETAQIAWRHPSAANSRQPRDLVATVKLLEQEATDLASFYDRTLEPVAGDNDANSDDDGEGDGGRAHSVVPADEGADFEITGFSEANFDNYFGVLNMNVFIVVCHCRGDSDDTCYGSCGRDSSS